MRFFRMSTEFLLINSTFGFNKLQNDLDEFYGKCQMCSVFSSWDWMFSWREEFKKQLNTELCILGLYKKDNLVGLVPLQIVISFPQSLVQVKILGFLSSGEPKDHQIESYKKDQYATEHVAMHRLRRTPHKYSYVIYHYAKYLQNLFIDIIVVLNNKKIKA